MRIEEGRDMKKLIDILFEPEEEEVVVEAPVSNIERKLPPKKEVSSPAINKPNPEVIKNDVLNKKPHSKSFGIIDVEELQVKKPVNNPKKNIIKSESKPYEAQPPMSPIFGVLKDNEENVLKTPQITSSSPSFLGTVLSPIYGTDTTKASEEALKEEMPFDKSEEIEINRLSTKEDDGISDVPEFKNVSIADIIHHDDETYVAEQEISLFDDIEEKK